MESNLPLSSTEFYWTANCIVKTNNSNTCIFKTLLQYKHNIFYFYSITSITKPLLPKGFIKVLTGVISCNIQVIVK